MDKKIRTKVALSIMKINKKYNIANLAFQSAGYSVLVKKGFFWKEVAFFEFTQNPESIVQAYRKSVVFEDELKIVGVA